MGSERLDRLTSELEADLLLQLRAAFAREDFLEEWIDDEIDTENRQVLAVVARLWADAESCGVVSGA